MAKTHFPHKFASEENLYYCRELPPKDMYFIENMTKKDRAEFEEFYNKAAEEEFDFKSTSLKYCFNDTEILQKAVSRFWLEIKELTAIDFIQHSLTIANLAQLIYRCGHIPENTLGLVPTAGYTPHKRQNSLLALKYLAYTAQKEGRVIRTSLNGKEKVLILEGRQLSIDGWDEENQEAFEVLGCAHHSCQAFATCKTARNNYPQLPNVFNPALTHREVYNSSMNRCFYIFKRVSLESM